MQDTNGDFNFLKSGLHKWAGDAYEFNKKEPYIELVTSPNNPNGFTRHDVVKGDKGILIDDLAFYQPQYTLILSLVEYDIMILSLQSRGNVFDVRLICLSPIEVTFFILVLDLLFSIFKLA
ncbi:putative transaminase [Helianthus annuus]|uniref:Transaminase n=1 Tax=Helianthus annuus TaxID=4232 RepID=A0A9K3NJW0_HELAN|nr:putative transaminase [Helianthus annuus]KAJ0915387.1 putative transaminase [Helianthus annuus]